MVMNNNSLVKPHIIICEGEDDRRFLKWLLDSFKQENNIFDDFWIIITYGNDKLHQMLESISRFPGFDDPNNTVASITVIFDAENKAEATANKIKNAFRKHGFAEPTAACSVCSDNASRVRFPEIKTGFALFPGCSKEIKDGTLEDLCLDALAKENAREILSDTDAALEKFKSQLPRFHKNRLHAYFSFTDKYVANTIGQAAQANAFCADIPAIDSLKTFLSKMHG